jgi:hypothetical protein
MSKVSKNVCPDHSNFVLCAVLINYYGKKSAPLYDVALCFAIFRNATPALNEVLLYFHLLLLDTAISCIFVY